VVGRRWGCCRLGRDGGSGDGLGGGGGDGDSGGDWDAYGVVLGEPQARGCLAEGEKEEKKKKRRRSGGGGRGERRGLINELASKGNGFRHLTALTAELVAGDGAQVTMLEGRMLVFNIPVSDTSSSGSSDATHDLD
jgi:hypothetical protein